MKITIVGSGYVGLVSGVCFADFGHTVTCVDKDPNKISMLNSGVIPIYEPGVEALMRNNILAGTLSFTTDLASSMDNVDVVFIAVGTPSRRGDGFADLTFVYEVAREIATHMNGFTVVVNKSTVPVGTGDEVEKIINKTRKGLDFEVVSNPEFLREGAAINDFKRPDRVIVGTDSKRAREVIRKVYRPLNINETPILFTSRRTSELIKYAANAFLATKISFINEMADLCEKIDANVQEVAKGVGLDKRIGPKFLHAGPGFGGSCFPKDTLALVRTAEQAGVELSIVNSVVKSNEQRKVAMADKIIEACGGVIGKRIAVLGLTFKPDTDDMRESPSLSIIPHLQRNGASICAYDPKAKAEASKLLENVTFADNAYDCANGADGLVIITEWDQFRALDMKRVLEVLAQPILVDLRNIYNAKEMRELGFKYEGVGIA